MDQALRDRLIRRGAELELNDLRARMKTLEAILKGRRETNVKAAPAASSDTSKKSRRGWSKAQRAAAAQRMKDMWAQKRKGK